jgi:hypothetical protein
MYFGAPDACFRAQGYNMDYCVYSGFECQNPPAGQDPQSQEPKAEATAQAHAIRALAQFDHQTRGYGIGPLSGPIEKIYWEVTPYSDYSYRMDIVDDPNHGQSAEVYEVKQWPNHSADTQLGGYVDRINQARYSHMTAIRGWVLFPWGFAYDTSDGRNWVAFGSFNYQGVVWFKEIDRNPANLVSFFRGLLPHEQEEVAIGMRANYAYHADLYAAALAAMGSDLLTGHATCGCGSYG